MNRVLVIVLLLAGGSARAAEPLYRWFSLPIEVERLPASCVAVPLRQHLDFTAILAELKVAGVVDERSLRLFHGDQEQPVQFSADPQPRP